jgi:hypothetical protein
LKLPILFGQNISVSSETGRKRQDILGGTHDRFRFFVGSENDNISYKSLEGLGVDSVLKTVINYLEVCPSIVSLKILTLNAQDEALYKSLYLLTPPLFHLLDDTDIFYRFRGILVIQTLLKRINRISPMSKHTAFAFAQWMKNSGISTLLHRVRKRNEISISVPLTKCLSPSVAPNLFVLLEPSHQPSFGHNISDDSTTANRIPLSNHIFIYRRFSTSF